MWTAFRQFLRLHEGDGLQVEENNTGIRFGGRIHAHGTFPKNGNLAEAQGGMLWLRLKAFTFLRSHYRLRQIQSLGSLSLPFSHRPVI